MVEEKTSPVPQQNTPTNQRPASILCLLDHVYGNMIIHYARSRVLHPRQGLEDIFEVIKEENLIDSNIKLVYLLAGRADLHLSASAFLRGLEKLLYDIARMNPRLMVVIAGIVLAPDDPPQARTNLADINLKMARLADRDHHWLYFNPNNCLMLGGEPQRKLFDNKGQLVKAGCRVVAQALVGASKSARMLQNFGVLPPVSFTS